MMTENNNSTVSDFNRLPMIVRGILLVSLGVSLLWLGTSQVKINLLSFLAMLAGISGLLFVQTNKLNSVLRSWLFIESAADILLGFAFLYMSFSGKNGLSDIRDMFSAFAILFAFMQLTFMYQVAITGFSENIKVLLMRGLTAIGYGLFGVILFMQPEGAFLTFLLNCIGLGPIFLGIGSIFMILYPIKRQTKK